MWTGERRFYFLFVLAVLASVLLGFSRTFFLRSWFPEWANVHAAPEPFFYFHGAVFTSWIVLLLAQVSLVSAGRVDLHRRLGIAGAVLAAAMIVVGVLGSLIAARRSTGFMDMPLPPLQFLYVPLADMAEFGVFVTLGFVTRRRAQSHKRFMLLATIAILQAAVGRWPIALEAAPLPIPGLAVVDAAALLFLVPLVLWDLASRGRVHPVTLWGGLGLIASVALRLAIWTTSAWTAFAEWAVGLIGG